jgi:cytoskeletal protein RodZ
MEQMDLDLQDSQPHIGHRLRMAREAMTMSPSCVARELKIQPKFIEAIEVLDRDSLPPIGYVLGYVRAYAGLVGLEPKEAVENFKTDSEVPENLGMRDRPHFVPKRQIRVPKGFFAASTVLSCFAVLAFWYSSKNEANSAAFSAVTTLTSINTSAADVQIVDPDRMLIKAVAPSWVEIKDKDGKTVISRILVVGETWQAHQDANVTLSARDAGALELYLGEDFMGQLGPKGTPIANIPMPRVHPDFMSDIARELAGLPPRPVEGIPPHSDN